MGSIKVENLLSISFRAAPLRLEIFAKFRYLPYLSLYHSLLQEELEAVAVAMAVTAAAVAVVWVESYFEAD
jgi:hypothetical protein